MSWVVYWVFESNSLLAFFNLYFKSFSNAEGSGGTLS